MIRLYLIILLLAASSSGYAAGLQKQFSIGIGTYALVVANDSPFFDDDRLSGFSLSGQYAISDMFALRAAYYALEHDDFSSIDATGFDFVGYVGAGLMSEGFKIYGGGGMFTETWEVGPVDKTFNGLQLSGGVGYSWNPVALDFVIAVRQKSDYEDLVAGTGARIDAAASASLILSARF